MVQMIQLTRGQEETLHRITTALEKIAENTKRIADNTAKDEPSPLSPNYHHSFGPDDDQDGDLPL